LRLALRDLPEREARAFVTDVAYGVLRWEPALDAALDPLLDAPERLPDRVRDVLRAGAFERAVRGTPPHAAVHAWVEMVKRGPKRHRPLAGLVNAVLRRVDVAREPLRTLPPWLVEEFRTLLGDDDAGRAAEGMLLPEPLWLTAFDLAGATAALERDGALVREGPVAGSLAVRAPKPLGDLDAFRRGLVQPQNPASLAVVLACEAVPGLRALDLCGGNAVKAAGLAAHGAEVTTVELVPRISAAGRRNLERLGLRAEHVVADLRTPPPLDPAPLVLLDAPCSGTGTLRGHPEIKRRVTPGAVAELAGLQRELLDTAAALTERGGRLVYAVCALTQDEGPRQTAAFLARHPDFAAVPAALPLPTRLAGAGGVVLPVDGLDGFFVAAFERSR
jgi:16S rRNA (cytosine967-C5)-methyltransferase